MKVSTRSCPKCGVPLSIPQSAPAKIVCVKCGAGIKLKAPVAASAEIGTAVGSAAAPTVSYVAPGLPRMPAGHEMVRELARGGLGVVYLARHQMLGDLRAVKRPRADARVDREQLLARFRREVQAVGALRNDHIIRAHDAGADDEGPFLVMEYLDGAPLSHLLARAGSLPVPQACELVRQTALGLQAAHERGLVHRDIKPSNLMLARVNSGGVRVVVIDWGLAKWAQAKDPSRAPALTVLGTTMGTADYIAPEQIADAGKIDIRADIYSLGATLYHLLAGKAPFQGRPDIDKLTAHEREEFPPLTQVRTDVPRELQAVLRKMVAKDPTQRFATPGEAANVLRPFCCGAESGQFAALLEPAGVHSGPVATETRALLDKQTELVAVPRSPIPGSPKRPLPMLGGAGALLGLLVLVSFFLWFNSGNKAENGVDRDKNGGNSGKPQYPLPPQGPVLAETENGKPGLVKKIAHHFEGVYHPLCVAFMPDGKRGVTRYYHGHSAAIWDLRHCVRLTHLELLPGDLNFSHIAVAPDGSRFFAPGGTLVARRNLTTYEAENPHIGLTDKWTALAISPDSKVVATAERDGKGGLIRFWNAKDRDPLKGEIKVKSTVIGLSFSPDGKYLAVSSGGLADLAIVPTNNEKILIYRYGDNVPVKTLPGHEDSGCWAGFLADGKRLFSASPYDGTLRVWNVEKESEVRKIQAAPNAAGLNDIQAAKRQEKLMGNFAFWPWGRVLTAHKDGSLYLWDLDTGKMVGDRIDSLSDKVGCVPTAMAISPDGHHALIGYNDGFLYLYRLPPPPFSAKK